MKFIQDIPLAGVFAPLRAQHGLDVDGTFHKWLSRISWRWGAESGCRATALAVESLKVIFDSGFEDSGSIMEDRCTKSSAVLVSCRPLDLVSQWVPTSMADTTLLQFRVEARGLRMTISRWSLWCGECVRAEMIEFGSDWFLQAPLMRKTSSGCSSTCESG